jgi:PDZ domain-containing protein
MIGMMRGYRYVLHPSWFLAAPGLILLCGLLWLPILAPDLPPLWTWALAIAALALAMACLWLHVLAHAWVTVKPSPPVLPAHRIAIFLIGDASQQWKAQCPSWREALASLAGPAVSLGLAGLGYLAWNLQPGRGINEICLFIALFNLLVALSNLAPGFPLDGGRLVRVALAWGWSLPSVATRIVHRIGWGMEAALAIWGGILIIQGARFGLELGLAILFLTCLLVWVGLEKPATEAEVQPQSFPHSRFGSLATTIALVAFLTTFAATVVPMAEGLEAPGLALAVEPMIMIDSAHREEKAGQFLLTSVINQTPILLGQRLEAIWDPSIRILPPQQVVPANTTPQEMMRVNFQMLEESQINATLVAFRLAGYTPRLIGDGVGVQDVLPESPAKGQLRAGDIITSVDGQPVSFVEDLLSQLRTKTPSNVVRLGLRRANESLTVNTGLLPGAQPGDPPRIGILVQTAGLRVETPFPVSIEPRKIVGGPSAGLIFTLAMYNLIAPDDLTQGRTIAGTGTIDANGLVGPIGGVEQKVIAAENAGASLFLCPADNYPDAQRVARSIRVLKVSTAQEAVDLLRRPSLTP